ncbi:MAG: heterodisulfide reductase subunit C [Kiritimatiellaeota bacterium]|nr:heterodisulfide reductase subunit C [Kiritimatiellota bacterium]
MNENRDSNPTVAPIVWRGPEFLREVEARSGARVSACLQCHKCSTGCPVAREADLYPSQMMRMILLGQAEELLASSGIWLCASCEACTTRCPMAIDIAGVMDALRILAVERKAQLGDAHGHHFNRAFLASVRRHGRVFEMGMMTAYKLRTRDLFSDVDKAPKLLLKGKLPLVPKRSRSARKVREIFRRADADQEGKP